MSVSLSSQQIHAFAIRSFFRVFETMTRSRCTIDYYKPYSGNPAYSPEMGSENGSHEAGIFAASVRFSGEFNGVCYLFFSDSVARDLSSTITGVKLERLEQDAVRDVCGELANMFAGTLTGAIGDRGLHSSLSVPEVSHGEQIEFSTDGVASHVRYAFDVNGKRVHADLLLADH